MGGRFGKGGGGAPRKLWFLCYGAEGQFPGEVGEVGAVAMEGAAAVGGEVEQDNDADGVDGFDRPSREAMGRL